MFKIIKQVFIALLLFVESLATKCMSLNNELCLIRPTLIDLNPFENNYHPFMISLDKCRRNMIQKYVFRVKQYM